MNAPTRDNGFFTETLASRDPDIAKAITQELGRQRDEIELIASENIVSRAVMEAQGSVMTNKYAEGYPGKRYYGGCEIVDQHSEHQSGFSAARTAEHKDVAITSQHAFTQHARLVHSMSGASSAERWWTAAGT